MLGKKKAESGAPLWVLTYGDMMSLLLTFFILLAAFADYDKNPSEKMIQAMQSLQQALGMKVAGNSRYDQIDFNALIAKLRQAIQNGNDRFKGATSHLGLVGESFRLRRIRDGMEITLGGPILFEPLSDALTPEGRQAVEEIGNPLKGHRNKIEVRGHAADEPRPADWTWRDAWKLSYQRASHVAEELVNRGVDVRTIRLVAVGDTEPIVPSRHEPARPGDNRRVEIIVRESLIDDYAGTAPPGGSPSTRPSPEVVGPLVPAGG